MPRSSWIDPLGEGIRACRGASVLDEGHVVCGDAIVAVVVTVGQHRFEVAVAEETRRGDVKVGP